MDEHENDHHYRENEDVERVEAENKVGEALSEDRVDNGWPRYRRGVVERHTDADCENSSRVQDNVVAGECFEDCNGAKDYAGDPDDFVSDS